MSVPEPASQICLTAIQHLQAMYNGLSQMRNNLLLSEKYSQDLQQAHDRICKQRVLEKEANVKENERLRTVIVQHAENQQRLLQEAQKATAERDAILQKAHAFKEQCLRGQSMLEARVKEMEAQLKGREEVKKREAPILQHEQDQLQEDDRDRRSKQDQDPRERFAFSDDGHAEKGQKQSKEPKLKADGRDALILQQQQQQQQQQRELQQKDELCHSLKQVNEMQLEKIQRLERDLQQQVKEIDTIPAQTVKLDPDVYEEACQARDDALVLVDKLEKELVAKEGALCEAFVRSRNEEIEHRQTLKQCEMEHGEQLTQLEDKYKCLIEGVKQHAKEEVNALREAQKQAEKERDEAWKCVARLEEIMERVKPVDDEEATNAGIAGVQPDPAKEGGDSKDVEPDNDAAQTRKETPRLLSTQDQGLLLNAIEVSSDDSGDEKAPMLKTSPPSISPGARAEALHKLRKKRSAFSMASSSRSKKILHRSSDETGSNSSLADGSSYFKEEAAKCKLKKQQQKTGSDGKKQKRSKY